MLNTDEAELHLNIEDLSASGIKKLEALYAHALGFDLSIKVHYFYPTPVLICYYKLSEVMFEEKTTCL